MGLIQEAMDKRQLGLPNPRLPPSEAKTRMATVQVPCLPSVMPCMQCCFTMCSWTWRVLQHWICCSHQCSCWTKEKLCRQAKPLVSEWRLQRQG